VTLPNMDTPVALCELPALENKWLFVGLDLAPVDSLETGIAVIDRDRKLVRMEKLESDRQIYTFLDSLGPKDGLIIALDIPKSLSFTSKWRQQQIKMHPLRLLNQDEASGSRRFAKRADDIYHALTSKGFFVVNFFSHYAKLRYNLNVPYRSRSPQGCRALQAVIKENLKIRHISSNLAPSSILDAMIGAYIAWQVYTAQAQQTKYRVLSQKQQAEKEERAKAGNIENAEFEERLEQESSAYGRSRIERFRPEKSRFEKSRRIPKKLVLPETSFHLYRDKDARLFIDPLKLLEVPKERRFRFRF